MQYHFPKSMFVLSLFTIFAIGCSKDPASSDVNATVNFSPLSPNSTWTYLNTPGTTFTLTATNRDTVAEGTTYRVLTNSAGSNVYLGKSGSNYYRFGSIAQLNIKATQELYLMDDKAVNGSWLASIGFSLPGVPIPISANLNYSIKEKGVSRIVSGKAFSNVTKVRLDLSVPTFGPLGGGDFYYAEGVGLIESVILLNIPGQAPISQTQVLTAYSIK